MQIARKQDGTFVRSLKPEPITVCGKCVDCKDRDQERRKAGKDGFPRYSARCGRCSTRHYRARVEANGKRRLRHTEAKRAYTKVRKDFCEGCGRKPTTPNQLEVDHIDGNHKNNDPSNLWTLCVLCHREKTWHFDVSGAI